MLFLKIRGEKNHHKDLLFQQNVPFCSSLGNNTTTANLHTNKASLFSGENKKSKKSDKRSLTTKWAKAFAGKTFRQKLYPNTHTPPPPPQLPLKKKKKKKKSPRYGEKLSAMPGLPTRKRGPFFSSSSIGRWTGGRWRVNRRLAAASTVDSLATIAAY